MKWCLLLAVAAGDLCGETCTWYQDAFGGLKTMFFLDDCGFSKKVFLLLPADIGSFVMISFCFSAPAMSSGAGHVSVFSRIRILHQVVLFSFYLLV